MAIDQHTGSSSYVPGKWSPEDRRVSVMLDRLADLSRECRDDLGCPNTSQVIEAARYCLADECGLLP